MEGIAKTKRSRFEGFTLIELLVVVTITAVLLAIAFVSYSSINKQSRDARRKSDVEQIRSALEMYRTDNGSYPFANGWENAWTATDNTTLAAALAPYLTPLPSDPTASSTYPYYYYIPTGCTGSTTTYCYGYCILSYMEKDVNAATTCTATIPTVPDNGSDRFSSVVKNP